MIRSLLKNRNKGISPLITIILLVVTMMIFVTMFSTWSKDSANQKLDFAKSNLKQATDIECNDATFKIEACSFDRYTKDLNLLINNQSDLDLFGLSLTIQGSDYDGNEMKLFGNFDNIIEKGSFGYISTTDTNFSYERQDLLYYLIDSNNFDLITVNNATCPKKSIDITTCDIYDSLDSNLVAHWSLSQDDEILDNTDENITLVNGGCTTTTDWIDSDSDGLADDFALANGTFDKNIVTGNGFDGNAQRVVYTAYASNYPNFITDWYEGASKTVEEYKSYRFCADYRCGSDGIRFSNDGSEDVMRITNSNEDDAKSVCTNISLTNDTLRLRLYSNFSTITPNVNDFWFEIDNLILKGISQNDISNNTNKHVAANYGDLVYTNLPNGDVNGAIVFNDDASHRYLRIPHSDDLSFGDSTSDEPFSISSWIYVENNVWFPILTKRDYTYGEYVFSINGSGNLRLLLLDNTAAGYIYKACNSVFEEDSWHFVTTTYDGIAGTSAYDGMHLYVDGVECSDTTTYMNGTYLAMHNTSQDAFIGGYMISGSTRYLADGYISDVKLFDKVLNTLEIENLYRETKHKYT